MEKGVGVGWVYCGKMMSALGLRGWWFRASLCLARALSEA